MACDLRVMADGPTVIGLPEVLMGICPGAGGTQRLPRLIGRARALDIMLRRCWISCDEALQIGLVNETCARESVVEVAMSHAHRLATRPKNAIAAIKQATLGTSGTDSAGYLHEQEWMFRLLRDRDAHNLIEQYQRRTSADGELPFYTSIRNESRHEASNPVPQGNSLH